VQIEYVREESPSAAQKLRVELLKINSGLKNIPERFSKEPYFQNNGKEYRSLIEWSYKIIYRVSETEVRILEVIHTSRNTTAIEKLDDGS